MKLITKTMKIENIANRWLKQYPLGGSQEKDIYYNNLTKLPKNATEDDVISIIGNRSWTLIKCEECKKECDTVVMFGTSSEEDYDSHTMSICPDCLKKALSKCLHNSTKEIIKNRFPV